MGIFWNNLYLLCKNQRIKTKKSLWFWNVKEYIMFWYMRLHWNVFLLASIKSLQLGMEIFRWITYYQTFFSIRVMKQSNKNGRKKTATTYWIDSGILRPSWLLLRKTLAICKFCFEFPAKFSSVSCKIWFA